MKYLIPIMCAASIVTYQNCSQFEMTTAPSVLGGNPNGNTGAVDPAFPSGWTVQDMQKSQATFDSSLNPIFRESDKCMNCHGAFQHPRFATDDSKGNHLTIFENKLIDLSDPASSYLYKKIAGGHQGFAPDVADRILLALNKWSDELKAEGIPLGGVASMPPNMPKGPSGSTPGGGVPQSFAEADPYSALAKVKYMLNGQALTDADLSVGIDASVAPPRLKSDGLRKLIAEWQKTEEYKSKIAHLMKLTLQINAEISGGNANRSLVGNPYPKAPASTLYNLLQVNVNESVIRTASDIIEEQKPFRQIVTTRRWAVTTGLLAFMAWIENPRNGQNSFTRAVETPIDDTNEFVALLENGSLTAADFSDWRYVIIDQAPDNASPPSFKDVAILRALKDGDTVKFGTARVGFFMSPAFQITWETNVDNDFRVLTNQTLITALNTTFETGDTTVQNDLTGLASKHAPQGTSCFQCHRLMDPMRTIFSKNLQRSYRYLTPVKTPTSFAFKGATRTMNSPDDMAIALATHPLFAKGWVQKLCGYLNSQKCDETDPEFLRLEDDFKSSGYNFKRLLSEALVSPLVTGAAKVKTHENQPFIVSAARRQHYCTAIGARIKKLQADRGMPVSTLPAERAICGASTALRNISDVIAEDGVVRGQPALDQPPVSSAIFVKSVVNMCASISGTYVGTGRLIGITPATYQNNLLMITEGIAGLPKSHPRHQGMMMALDKVHVRAIELGLSATEAMKHAFEFACASPELTAVGL